MGRVEGDASVAARGGAIVVNDGLVVVHRHVRREAENINSHTGAMSLDEGVYALSYKRDRY